MAYGTASPCKDLDIAGHQRRCVVTGAVSDTRALIRFVVDPDGRLVADVAERLPGRGYWVSANADSLGKLGRRNPVARVARRAVAVPADVTSQTAALLLRRGQNLMTLARRAGMAVAGYEKSHACLLAGKAGLILAARDGNADDQARLRRLGDGVPVVDVYRASELGLAFGRDRTVHAVIQPGALAEGIQREADRLAGFRPRGRDAELNIKQGSTEQA